MTSNPRHITLVEVGGIMAEEIHQSKINICSNIYTIREICDSMHVVIMSNLQTHC